MGNSWKIKGLSFRESQLIVITKKNGDKKFVVRKKFILRFSDHNILYNSTILHTK